MNRILDNWPPLAEVQVDATPVVLAHEASFELPPLHVEPALRRVLRDDGAETIVEPLVMQVLVALAGAHGDILTRDELVDRCWSGRIVGDDSIARVIALLRKLGAEFGQGAFTIETITKVGYRLLVSDNTAQPAPVARSNRVRLVGLVGATGLAVAAAALWAFALPGDAASATTTISVEPVTNSAGDREAQRFASDLTSDFARLAGAMGNVSVIEAGAPRQSGGSDYVMRASVERQRERLTAQARLVSTADGAVLWSRAFADETGSMAALREQIAISAAEVMRCGLEKSAAGTLRDDPDSARLFFGMCEAVGDDDWPKAKILARQVVARRPELSAGWAGLAFTTVNEAWVHPNSSASRLAAARGKARGYALKAIRLDPASGFGYHALAMVEAEVGNISRTLAAYERGLEFDPDFPHLHKGYGVALFNAGYAKAGAASALRAMALDPTSRFVYDNAVRRLLATGRRSEAFAIQAKADRLWPDHPEGQAQRLRNAIDYGDPAAALAMLERMKREPGREPDLPTLARALLAWRLDPAGLDLASLGRDAEAEFREYPSSAWSIAGTMIRMGQTDRAFAWLARAPVTGTDNQWSILFWPEAAPLRRDPRFFAAMARLGLVDLWRKRRQWPDFCSEPGLRYDCRAEAARIGKTTQT